MLQRLYWFTIEFGLIKEDDDFAVFYWSNASNDDINAVTGSNGEATVALIGMIMLQLPL